MHNERQIQCALLHFGRVCIDATRDASQQDACGVFPVRVSFKAVICHTQDSWSCHAWRIWTCLTTAWSHSLHPWTRSAWRPQSSSLAKTPSRSDVFDLIKCFATKVYFAPSASLFLCSFVQKQNVVFSFARIEAQNRIWRGGSLQCWKHCEAANASRSTKCMKTLLWNWFPYRCLSE